jgi:hypothetical protein
VIPVREVVWHDDLQRWIPALGALSFDPDGLSVYVAEIAIPAGFNLSAVASRGGLAKGDRLLFSCETAIWTSNGYSVVHSPDDVIPLNIAHASVQKGESMTKQEHKENRLAVATEMVCVHGQLPTLPPMGA